MSGEFAADGLKSVTGGELLRRTRHPVYLVIYADAGHSLACFINRVVVRVMIRPSEINSAADKSR